MAPLAWSAIPFDTRQLQAPKLAAAVCGYPKISSQSFIDLRLRTRLISMPWMLVSATGDVIGGAVGWTMLAPFGAYSRIGTICPDNCGTLVMNAEPAPVITEQSIRPL